MRGVRRADLQAAAPGDPLRPALYSAVHGSWRVANEADERVWVSAGSCSSGRSPWAGLSFDLVTKSLVFAESARPPAPTVPIVPQHPGAAHQSKHRRTLGLRRRHTRQQPDLRRPVGRRRDRHLLLALRPGRRLEPGTDRRPGLDHGRCDGQLLRSAGVRTRPRLRPLPRRRRSASTARSSTSPTTCWSPARSPWSSTPCGPRIAALRRSIGRTSEARRPADELDPCACDRRLASSRRSAA